MPGTESKPGSGIRTFSTRAFIKLVLQPSRDARFSLHTGPFLFEFQRHGLSVQEFCSGLDGFFARLPKDFRYAVEIRNAALLALQYHEVLRRHGVTHVYSHWSFMPSLAEQHQRMGTFTAPFSVVRLQTPLKMTHEATKQRVEPYNRIVDELPEMRQDTVRIVRQAAGENRTTYVLVNNRAEGNALMTIQALVESLRD
ncbi:MAG: DUF72 domain-containing protein [Nitrospira sp.]|nr:DUF72 domain-containing protein [Nitrospira sp.]